MAELTVLTWNMAMGSPGGSADWSNLQDLMDRHEVDVALLNEVSTASLMQVPSAIFEVSGTHGLDRRRRDWSTVIVSRHPVYEIRDARAQSYGGRRPDVPFQNSRPGSWVAAVVERPGEEPVTCVSIYGLMDELSDASVHRALSDLSPVLSDPRYRSRLVLGGDLNITTQYAPGHRLDACMAVLARIAAYGLTDCLAEKWEASEEECGCSFGDDCRHTRTRVDPGNPDNPLQVDYVFASETLVAGAYSCRTLDRDEWVDSSDHAPILTMFSG